MGLTTSLHHFYQDCFTTQCGQRPLTATHGNLHPELCIVLYLTATTNYLNFSSNKIFMNVKTLS